MIVIIDCGIGNLGSVANTLDMFGSIYKISNKTDDILKADVVIFPGVGSAKAGMNNLQKLGLKDVLINMIKRGKPFLGICLGMQLLFERSEEGNVDCLGLLKGKVKKFKKERKIPQIGWNNVSIKQFDNFTNNIIFNDIHNNSYFYFVNSYYCQVDDKSIVVGESEYGEKFASVIIKDNIVATQFHPEKSGQAGMQFLKNWRNLC